MLDFNVGRTYRTNETEGIASESQSRPSFGGGCGGGDGAVRKGCQFLHLMSGMEARTHNSLHTIFLQPG